jgi:dolichol-phosphate mannosyltransferase
MARAVVTGATGFVGANLARRLLAEGHEVHLLLRPGFDGWRLDGIRHRVHVHLVELTSAEATGSLLNAVAPQWVFHLAVYGAYDTQTDLRAMVATNIVSTINLVAASINASAEVIVNTGSSSEYGFKERAPTEADAAVPNSAYATTKLAATLLCSELARRHGVRVPTLRLYSVYGPFEQPTRLIPTLIVAGLEGRLPDLVDPRVARDFVFVEDVCDAYVRAATRPLPQPDAVYNVGSAVETTIESLVHLVRDLLHVAGEPRWGTYPSRAWDTHAWVANNVRVRTELGWRPHVTLEAGLQRTADWLRGRPDLLARYRAAQSAARS